MEYITCTTCGQQYEQPIEFNHRITKRHHAANKDYYCQQSERILRLVHKKAKSHIKSTAHLKILFQYKY